MLRNGIDPIVSACSLLPDLGDAPERFSEVPFLISHTAERKSYSITSSALANSVGGSCHVERRRHGRLQSLQ
jgi:hypothetical protein